MKSAAAYRSPLHQMAMTTATDFWNDSCSIEELTYAIENGAVGATTNPTIVGEVLKKEMPAWRTRIAAIIAENPTSTEDDITWRLNEEMAVGAAELLLPVFEREDGLKGRLSIQTNPKFYRSASRIVEQGLRFAKLAPNIQVKVPATAAGIDAIEELTAEGVSVNATVCFTVPQALAVAEAVERGLRRALADGVDVTAMSPVCTIMVGRLDDWMAVLVARDAIAIDPGSVQWAGIACIKHAYSLYRKRGYRARLLAAAYRHHLHWSELIGGDIVMTIPYRWQKLINASDIPVVERMDDPVSEKILSDLHRRLPDFRRAFAADGMEVGEFDSFGATARTLRQFIGSYQELVAAVREFVTPNPDTK
jgi:transaldolase